MPDAPKWSGKGYVRYEFQNGATKGLAFGASYVCQGRRPEGDTPRWSEAWNRWDANATYRRKLLNRVATFSIVVHNATNRTFRVDRDIFARPRQWIGAMAVEF